ncbi:MAG: methyltransferase domain-containing protein [Candidatus Peribacteraceae bacterium]
MRDFTYFFRQFLKHPKQISSMISTSGAVARRLAMSIRRSGRLVIVEYGPGMGVLARAILRSGRLSGNSKLILIEKTPGFVRHLHRRFTDPRVHVVQGSAEDVLSILRKCGEAHADYVFSSIPLSLMPSTTCHRILSATWRCLRPTGIFTVFLFRHRVREVIQRYFPRVRTRLELFNIPPLFVFAATKGSR